MSRSLDEEWNAIPSAVIWVTGRPVVCLRQPDGWRQFDLLSKNSELFPPGIVKPMLARLYGPKLENSYVYSSASLESILAYLRAAAAGVKPSKNLPRWEDLGQNLREARPFSLFFRSWDRPAIPETERLRQKTLGCWRF